MAPFLKVSGLSKSFPPRNGGGPNAALRDIELEVAEGEFVCLVGSFGRSGDGLVRYDSQWPPDLQRQGIPAVLLPVPHLTAMQSKLVAQTLADLVRRPQPRWTPGQVEAARSRIFREPAVANQDRQR